MIPASSQLHVQNLFASPGPNSTQRLCTQALVCSPYSAVPHSVLSRSFLPREGRPAPHLFQARLLCVFVDVRVIKQHSSRNPCGQEVDLQGFLCQASAVAAALHPAHWKLVCSPLLFAKEDGVNNEAALQHHSCVTRLSSVCRRILQTERYSLCEPEQASVYKQAPESAATRQHQRLL